MATMPAEDIEIFRLAALAKLLRALLVVGIRRIVARHRRISTWWPMDTLVCCFLASLVFSGEFYCWVAWQATTASRAPEGLSEVLLNLVVAVFSCALSVQWFIWHFAGRGLVEGPLVVPFVVKDVARECGDSTCVICLDDLVVGKQTTTGGGVVQAMLSGAFAWCVPSSVSGATDHLHEIAASPKARDQYEDLGLALDKSPKSGVLDRVATELDGLLGLCHQCSQERAPALQARGRAAPVALGASRGASMRQPMAARCGRHSSGLPRRSGTSRPRSLPLRQSSKSPRRKTTRLPRVSASRTASAKHARSHRRWTTRRVLSSKKPWLGRKQWLWRRR